MFDDPKLRLQELEEALKATEIEEEEDWLQDVKDLLNESATEPMPIRNKANNYGQSRDLPRMAYADEEMKESDALYVEKPPRKGAGGLVFLALLELIGMGLVVLWWVRWML